MGHASLEHSGIDSANHNSRCPVRFWFGRRLTTALLVLRPQKSRFCSSAFLEAIGSKMVMTEDSKTFVKERSKCLYEASVSGSEHIKRNRTSESGYGQVCCLLLPSPESQ